MLTIGELAQATGVKVPTIRYYEQVGLLFQADRSDGNQRLCDRKAQDRLAFIRHARDLGFSDGAIRDLINLSDNSGQSCDAADAMARAQLIEVERRISRLVALKAELQRMILQCAGGTVADCRIIEILGNHASCAMSHESELGSVGLDLR